MKPKRVKESEPTIAVALVDVTKETDTVPALQVKVFKIVGQKVVSEKLVGKPDVTALAYSQALDWIDPTN